MGIQKYINNTFFAVMSGLVSYSAAQLAKINDKIDAIEHTVYKLHSRSEVQREINDKFDFGLKDHETRIRRFEHLTLRPEIRQRMGG